MAQRLGIIGGGQLGRMLGFAAKRLDFEVTVIDPTPNSPAGQVVDHQIVAGFTDETAIQNLANNVDFLTFEIELANAALLKKLSESGTQVNPTAETLLIIKDKFKQKEFLRQHKLPVANFAVVETEADIQKAAQKFGYPLLLKARFDAYDGRGNAVVKKASEILSAMKKLGGKNLYVEQFVPFTKELAVMVARSTTSEIKTYPVVETIHQNNICHVVLAPAPVAPAIRKQVQKIATKVMKQITGAGVFGIEFFLTKDKQVMINEIAPRVHNSGHYTLEACVTDQFEQHIRAVTGLPLGSTDMIVSAACMINILGDRQAKAEISGLHKALKIPNVGVHIYGKAETKLERKMGHLTATDTSLVKAKLKATKARKLLSI